MRSAIDRARPILLALACVAIVQAGDPKGKPDPEPIVPSWAERDRSRVEIEVVKTGKIERQPAGTTETTWKIEYTERVEEVADGRPVAVSRTFSRHRLVTKTSPKGKRTKVSKATNKLEGKTLPLRAKRGERVIESSGLATEGFVQGLDWCWLLPGKPVRVGDSWKIESGWDLARHHFMLAGQTTTCTLVRRDAGRVEVEFRAGPDEEPLIEGRARVDPKSGKVIRVEWKTHNRNDARGISIEHQFRFERKLLEPAPKPEEKND